MHKATAVVAALGIAVGVTACGTETQSGALPTTRPIATASLSPAPIAMATDSSLKLDLKIMAAIQEEYIYDHPGKQYVAVTATKPGGRASVSTPNDLMTSRGNVIAVKVGLGWFCVSGYNKAATEATSATKSMLFKSEEGGIQTAVGAC
jgi:hypothetical protein